MEISQEEYKELNPLLFSLGYRLLGSVADTEDLVQETLLKAAQIDGKNIKNKKAYLCKVMTNSCLDHLKSAQHKKEQYVGPWNPEPIIVNQGKFDSTLEVVLNKEGLSIAYLRLMENLTPHERAVFLLREAFDFPYEEIAGVVNKNKDNCRKIFSRAKTKLSTIQEESLNYECNKSIVEQFVEAFQHQKTDELLYLLSDEVILYSDGGGKVKAAIRPIIARTNVVRFVSGIVKKVPESFYYELKNVNGQPGIVTYVDGNIHSVISFYIAGEEIKEIYMVLNPEKLKMSTNNLSTN
ncbi:RNA polymerase sigma-70 factor [Alkalibacillus haloalkaliphilus]|uniref:RNA polymerase sigma factor SigJ n=1 Tax=Alkalibacillus haloalkaliphilus TaxID=94136 RepID=A0A511W7T2_9BACI|nr:RNA polymerase sigma-70 factor [Alkalibacillus haloalkaliphilus]GEN46388.1 RNA polymerase sigma factor SigJ [Alkalibacillus haloalkaliphilus]